ncbi:hypothetical protein, partial [Alloacidobacterium sp.]|uniref:hypothetical protein n=1 Tax=Alloacidobacterium sp. TaxID=2951999 RepID=UPI002D47063D
QSLNRTLAKMEKFIPATVTFTGTCTEYVLVDGFTGLTLKGVNGATIQQPATQPPTSPSFVLSVKASRSITFSGFAVHSQPTVTSSIGIGGGSTDVLLSDITADGSWGVWVYEASQVWLVRMKVNLTSGFAAVSAFDKSDVHIVNGLLHRPANGNFNAGLLVSSGHVTMQGITIRDMQQGININASGSVDLVNFDSSASSVDVIIDNPSGTNSNGAIVTDGSSLNVESARLLITNAGQPGGGDTGGVLVNNGSTLNAGSDLVVSGSQNQGVVVSNNSHAELGGSSITGSAHGGLVVVNLSTATADPSNPLTVIGSNGTDLFCDSSSQIAGTLNIANASVVNCKNLLPGTYKSLP